MRQIFKIVRNLSANLTYTMIKALFSRPLLLMPTVWATIESIIYSELNFLEAHGGRGAANAFRHAAWNLLIIKNCTFFTTQDKAEQWAKMITDLHEECFPNEAFDNQMDLHNNQIGRQFYLQLVNQGIKSKAHMIKELVKITKKAKGLTDENLIQNHPNHLVYYLEN